MARADLAGIGGGYSVCGDSIGQAPVHFGRLPQRAENRPKLQAISFNAEAGKLWENSSMSTLNEFVAPKENVIIRAGDCSLSLLPAFGGKVASILVKGHELLQTPLAPVKPRTHTMAFDASDASGWDECMPSVAACTVQTDAGAAQIPDHGDLWRVPWERISQQNKDQGGSVTLRGKCFSLPLELERKLTLTQTGEGWHLQVVYKVTNTGTCLLPWSWAAHTLYATEPGDRIVLPPSVRTLRVEGSGGGRLGKYDDVADWPVATLANGEKTDLSAVQAPDSGIGDKLFAGPLSQTENWCVLERPSTGVRIRVRFDEAATPYLGLWICYGGWPERPGPKQICVALEPSTAPVDSLAQSGSWSRVLGAGESFAWPMHIDLQTI